MTRLLLDENFPHSAGRGLAAAGHDVEHIAVVCPGISDIDVLARARRDQRYLLTFDSDFGDLVFHRGAEPPPAILFLRLHPIVADEVLALSLRALQDPVPGAFVVVTRDAMRRRLFMKPRRDGPH